MNAHPLLGPLILAAILISAVPVLLSARSLLRLLMRGPVGRFLIRPIYNVTLRPIGWLLRGTARIARGGGVSLQETQAGLVAVPYSAMAQMISIRSEAEKALGEVPPEIKRMVKRRGWPFRTVDANEAAVSLQATLTLADARRNLDSAHHYYKEPMGRNISPVLLYEDSEEALIIRILKDVDFAYFYVMRRINRNIGRNITKIIAIETILVASFPLVFNAVKTYAPLPAEKIFRAAALGSIVFAYALLLWLFRTFYGKATQINAQSFNYFMQTYFGRLLNQYKSADAQFESVPNDRVAPLPEVQQAASIWFINLHWLAARQWFLDLYARNMIFQIVRNRWFSWVGVLVYFAIAAAVYGGLAFLPAVRDSELQQNWNTWSIYVPFAFLLLAYWWTVTGLLSEFWSSVDPNNWSGFRTMDVDGMISRHIGRNVLEIVDKRRNPYGTQAAQPYVPPPPPPPTAR